MGGVGLQGHEVWGADTEGDHGRMHVSPRPRKGHRQGVHLCVQGAQTGGRCVGAGVGGVL